MTAFYEHLIAGEKQDGMQRVAGDYTQISLLRSDAEG
jgi:hypothetical protein